MQQSASTFVSAQTRPKGNGSSIPRLCSRHYVTQKLLTRFRSEKSEGTLGLPHTLSRAKRCDASLIFVSMGGLLVESLEL